MNQSFTDRFNEFRLRQYQTWLNQCDALLTENNVPEWVTFSGNPAPSNTIPSRLKWYLARRKAVGAQEIDRDTRELNQRMADVLTGKAKPETLAEPCP